MSKQLKYIDMKHLLILMGLIISISVYTQNSKDYYTSGNTKYLAGDYKGCVQDNTKAIALDSANANAYFSRAEAKNQLLDYNAALLDYSKARHILEEATPEPLPEILKKLFLIITKLFT